MWKCGRTFVYAAVSAALGIACSLPTGASAAETQGNSEDDTRLEEIVVTGFRGSLNTALAEKRAETAAIDVIAAEDMGKFPDSNLAESMQRVPFGVLANYTRVESEIEYILTSSGGVVSSSTKDDLVGLSKSSASGTLFYDDGRFSIRSTGTFRDKYIRGIPASAGSDLKTRCSRPISAALTRSVRRSSSEARHPVTAVGHHVPCSPPAFCVSLPRRSRSVPFMTHREPIGLTSRQVQNFIDDGFVKIEQAFGTDLASFCRDELWAELGLSPDHPERWTQPVIRVAAKASPPFIEAANTPLLHRAYDQLAGEGRWLAPRGLGTFPIRFPSPQPPGDDGWHIDVSFGDNNPDFMEWRANVKSSGRALLMLFLLSDVGPDDAPTKIRKGSHLTMARELLPYGEAGATLRQLSAEGYISTADCEVELATGAAGTVYLCHPFLVHSAQPHRGLRPRFMAQPPLLPRGEFDPSVPPSPVQIAIRRACGLGS